MKLYSQKYTTALLSLCAVLTACGDEDELRTQPDDGYKAPIELSVGGEDGGMSSTRAVITTGDEKNLKPFDVDSKIFMVMQSEYDDTDHIDYGGAQTTKYNVARGDIKISNNDTPNNRSIVEFDNQNIRYWDDAHARSSMLSIWAYAQMGQSWTECNFNGTKYNTVATDQPWKWKTTEIVPTILTWRATHLENTEIQNQQSVLCQDLLFSNNLALNGDDDNRLKFNFSTHKFPQAGEANMIFYHAMSKITINLVRGDGYAENEFQFPKDNTGKITKNVELNGFNAEGTFNIKQGEFTSTTIKQIPSICLNTTPNEGMVYTLQALVVPGTNLWTSAVTNAFSFTIDDNRFDISAKKLAELIRAWKDTNDNQPNASFEKLEAGKHYVFTFRIGKKKIDYLTAQLAEWEEVEAKNFDPSNARIELELMDAGQEQKSGVAFYRALDKNEGAEITDAYENYAWQTGYTKDGMAQANYVDALSRWTTNWYWESNRHFYHFRSIMPQDPTDTENSKATTPVKSENGKDYVSLTSAADYTDIRWGAPFIENKDAENQNKKLTYSTTYGFDGKGAEAADPEHQIYKAIGPTDDKIILITFHAMSDLTIKLQTTSDDSKVTLVEKDAEDNITKSPVVKLVNYYKDGKIQMGDGLVLTTGNRENVEIPMNPTLTTNNNVPTYSWGAIPQDLKAPSASDIGVQLHITTPDDNVYIIDLAEITTSTSPVPTQYNMENPYTALDGGRYVIDYWYPNYKYTYTLTLKKKGIFDLKATIVDWEKVEAEDIVQIK